MYEHMTYEAIMGRMMARVPSNVSTREGSIVYDAVAPAAAELHLAYLELDRILLETFGDTASRPYLIRRARERGIAPDPATHAVFRGEFEPADVEIATGAVFNLDRHNYEVIEKTGPGEYWLQCQEAGSDGNLYMGDLIPQEYIQRLRVARLVELLVPARDEQETESLRQEYLDSFGAKAFGGNKKQYREWTNGLDGVGATKVTPFWKGGGTVLLTILGADYSPAGAVLVEAVQTAVDPLQDGLGDGMAPIGHVVTVRTAAPATINLQTTVTLAEGYALDTLPEQVRAEFAAYLLELRKDWESTPATIVRLAQVENRVMNLPGVVDISGTRLNGREQNLVLDRYQVPVPGEVVL